MATAEQEKDIESMLCELQVYGFAVAKHIAKVRGLRGGTMPCPLCQKMLRFYVSTINGHMRAKCETDNCINLQE